MATSAGRSTLVQTEIPQKILAGLLWNFAHSRFKKMTPWLGWSSDFSSSATMRLMFFVCLEMWNRDPSYDYNTWIFALRHSEQICWFASNIQSTLSAQVETHRCVITSICASSSEFACFGVFPLTLRAIVPRQKFTLHSVWTHGKTLQEGPKC